MHDRIEEKINQIPVIDTHEHIPPKKETTDADVSYLFEIFRENSVNYNFSPLGMPEDAWDIGEFDLRKAWERIKPYMGNVMSSSFFRMFLSACRNLFDMDLTKIDSFKKWKELSERIAESNRRDDWYDFVIGKKAKVETAIIMEREVEEDYFRSAPILDEFLAGFNGSTLASLEKKHGGDVGTWEDYLELLKNVFENLPDNTVAIKSNLAYRRSLKYENPSEVNAKKVFPPKNSSWEKSISAERIKDFQDFMLGEIVKNATKSNLPVQIHTGSIAYLWGDPADTNPLHLTELFKKYKGAKFAVLHGGYPYSDELGMLARFWPNVYIDLAWMPIGPPGYTAAKRILSKWIDTVPWNKLMWGGDTGRVEELYGAALTGRRMISEVLADKVGDGIMDEETAIELGEKILRKNALEFYDL